MKECQCMRYKWFAFASALFVSLSWVFSCFKPFLCRLEEKVKKKSWTKSKYVFIKNKIFVILLTMLIFGLKIEYGMLEAVVLLNFKLFYRIYRDQSAFKFNRFSREQNMNNVWTHTKELRIHKVNCFVFCK